MPPLMFLGAAFDLFWEDLGEFLGMFGIWRFIGNFLGILWIFFDFFFNFEGSFGDSGGFIEIYYDFW